MFQPEDLKRSEKLLWSPGTGEESWELFCACADGDLQTVTRLIDQKPALIRAHYEYRTPLYFAVRENHIAIAVFLARRSACRMLRPGPGQSRSRRIEGATRLRVC